ESGIAAAAIAYADVDILPLEIDEVGGSVDANLELGMCLAELVETGHQPFRSQGRRRGDGENIRVVEIADAVDRCRQPVATVAQTRQADLPRLGQPHRLAMRMEQRQAPVF